MTFDALVTHFEERLLPSLRHAEALARACRNCKEVEVVSLRVADLVHTIGIRCHPKWAAGNLEYLSLGVNVTGLEKLAARAEIHWTDCFDARTGSGYTKSEARVVLIQITSAGDIDRFVDRWNKLIARFAKIALQGKPSPRPLRWWHGAKPDRFGCKLAG